jgi:adenine-specific DNA-methyltransferase
MSKTTIFVSGSRSIKFLPPGALQALDRIMAQGFIILVGDCLGVDVLIQRYLLAKGYRQVTVCHINARPRHNLGFNSMQVQGTRQTDKEAYMGRTANFGLAIWDGASPGTAKNIARVKTKVIDVNPNNEACIVCNSTNEIGFVRMRGKCPARPSQASSW